ncbi:DUF3048 domain-containing protein [Cohnella sp. CFH 77786]|uniref:DUF3048 domain-containing protein n=1 Tax=Cohnella sp. CFH 77786 TaxID=2662265 RepID=UPI001C610617|nr:DUF3048 domain-containing protein [Cohnella sp. CFH 77786]MBW5445717.1 DUF3048 domain-containing protein [Cohnella sp. CFH 77786]
MPAQTRLSRSLRLPLALLASGLLAATAACSGGAKPPVATEATATPVPTVSASASPSATPDVPVPGFTAPLTGLPVDHEVTNRPFAVMINNLAPARPQSGLTQADTVWELLAEGGITRLVGIFQSKEFADPIGPVRSIRPYFIEVGEFYSGVLVHAGASNDAFAILQGEHKEDLDEITNAGAFFWRDKSRKAPHNLYTNLEKLRAGAAHRKYADTATVPALSFNSFPDLTGAAPASEVSIRFELKNYKVSYTYDSAKGVYARFINGKPHVDKNNDEQLTAANLVVLAASTKAYDDYGRLEVDLKSGGEAVLFQQGKAIACQWQRDGNMIRIVKDGKELPFLPGVTYYHVVPKSQSLSSHVTYQ